VRCTGNIAILVAGLIVVSCTSFAQVADLAVLGVANFTQKSVGETISGFRGEQSSRAAAGLSVEYSQWWRNNALSIAYTISPTDSKIIYSYGFRDQWAITRNELDLSWIRRLRRGKVEPFIQAGLGAIVLNGGRASGLDRQFALVAGVGADLRVSSHVAFRYGLKLDFLRASNFSDTNYKGGRTFIVEPKFGLVWRFGSRRIRPV
jgi:hypothetical protein